MIKPTVGRVVLYNPLEEERNDIRHAAIVVMVHSDECVNLTVFDANGVPYHRQSVVLVQDAIVNPKFGECEWMPYQHGQAAKTEDISGELLARIQRIENLLVEEAGFELADLAPAKGVPVDDTAELTEGDAATLTEDSNVVDLNAGDSHASGITDFDEDKPKPGDADYQDNTLAEQQAAGATGDEKENDSAGSDSGPDGTDESTDDVTEDDAGTSEGAETETQTLGEAAEETVIESAALSGLKAHAIEVELESISFMDAEGEPSKEGEQIHEAEYTFTDGVSFVISCDEHVHLAESGLSPVDKTAEA